MLTRDAILGADDLAEEVVEVTEWGGSVRVRGLTGAGRDVYETSLWEDIDGERQVNLENARAKLVALGCVGEDGEPLFTMADVEALGKKSATPLVRIAAVVRRLSGLDDGDEEEARGNSPAAPSGDSISG